MKKIMVLLPVMVSILFIECAMYKLASFKETDVIELLGPNAGELQGKVFSIALAQSEFSAEVTKNHCLQRAATIAFDRGYSAFTILNENIYRYRVPGPEIPAYYTGEINMDMIIQLITEKEYDTVKNAYLVSKYLPKGYIKKYEEKNGNQPAGPDTARPQTAAIQPTDSNAAGEQQQNQETANISNQETAASFFNSGMTYYNMGEYDRAIADYNQAVMLDPNNAGVYRGRGNAYNAQKNYEQAIADYTEVIRLEPSANSYLTRGRMYSAKGDYDRAIADYTLAIMLDPNNTYVYNNRGVAYARKQDYDRAIADFEAALRIDPNIATARKNLDFARKARGY